MRTFSAHASLDALPEAAVATTVAFVLVNQTGPFETATVLLCFADGSSEEAFASIARTRPIVFARRLVMANAALARRH